MRNSQGEVFYLCHIKNVKRIAWCQARFAYEAKVIEVLVEVLVKNKTQFHFFCDSNAWRFMQSACLVQDSHEKSSLIFTER